MLNPKVPVCNTAPCEPGTYDETNPAGTTYTYPAVPVNAFLDLGFTWRLPFRGSQQISWSLNGTNILDNKRPTFAGVPSIGRMIMTRIQYGF